VSEAYTRQNIDRRPPDAPQPLAGKRILVTRTRDQAGALSERLRALGAQPIEFPTIRIVPPQDWRALDAALRRLYAAHTPEAEHERYDWLVLTSANGVHICMQRLNSLGYDTRALQPVRVAAIGPATAAALAQYGVSVDLVPDEYIAEGVATALIEHERRRGGSIAGQHILLARAAEVRKVLVDLLQQAGALVDEVAAYSTLPAASDDEQGREVLHLLQRRQLDILTFTSSSTVRNFVAWLKSCQQGSGADLMAALSSIAIACIGPVTARTARELGLPVTIEAREFTIDGLVQAIVQAFYEDKHD
jgi:uroporphyrinogen-III synthase